jgi:hypothetical protein
MVQVACAAQAASASILLSPIVRILNFNRRFIFRCLTLALKGCYVNPLSGLERDIFDHFWDKGRRAIF